MTETEFHQARRMFAVLADRTVLVAPREVAQTHAEWLLGALGTAGAEDVIERRVRGYVLGTRLVAYRGPQFSHHVNKIDLGAAVAVLAAVYPVAEVGLGAVRGPSQPWAPRHVLALADAIDKFKWPPIPSRP